MRLNTSFVPDVRNEQPQKRAKNRRLGGFDIFKRQVASVQGNFKARSNVSEQSQAVTSIFERKIKAVKESVRQAAANATNLGPPQRRSKPGVTNQSVGYQTQVRMHEKKMAARLTTQFPFINSGASHTPNQPLKHSPNQTVKHSPTQYRKQMIIPQGPPPAPGQPISKNTPVKYIHDSTGELRESRTVNLSTIAKQNGTDLSSLKIGDDIVYSKNGSKESDWYISGKLYDTGLAYISRRPPDTIQKTMNVSAEHLTRHNPGKTSISVGDTVNASLARDGKSYNDFVVSKATVDGISITRTFSLNDQTSDQKIDRDVDIAANLKTMPQLKSIKPEQGTAAELYDKFKSGEIDFGILAVSIDALRATGVNKVGEQTAPGKYDTVSVVPNYNGEHLPNNNIFGTQVEYLSKSEVHQREVFIDNGNLVNVKGEKLDAKNKDLIFVMDPSGKIYAEKKKLGKFHHSSFLASKPVASAGYLSIDDGKITGISMVSGHYHPTGREFEKIMNELRERGADLSHYPPPSA